MKKLLTVILFAFIGISLYANNDNYYAKLSVSVSNKGTGSGTVYVTSSGKDVDTKSTTTSGGVVSFTINATPDANSYLKNWEVLSGSVESIEGNTAKMKASTTANAESAATTASIAAIFDKVVDVGNNSSFTIVHYEGTTTTKSIDITVHNGGTSNLTVASGTASFFEYTISPKDGDATGQYWVLTINVLPTANNGDNTTLTLQTNEGKQNTVSFTVKEVQTIYMVGAPNGTYTAKQTLLDKTYSLTANVTDTAKVVIDDTDGFAFKFDFTPATGYRLNRLKVTIDDVVSYLYDDVDDGVETITTIFESGAIVQPEFIPSNYAQFIVLGTDTTIHYNDLERAMAVAANSSSKTVAVYKKGTAKDVNGVILPKPASGSYTIPAGITLLVPGNAAYKSKLGYFEAADFGTGSTSTCWRKLIVEAGTTINLQGNICVFSPVSATQGYTGQPTTYGQIDLQDGSHIVAESGSKLCVYGYISGNPNTSSVTVNRGADVYEVLQFTDWRGGTAVLTGGMIDNDQEILPLAQYYVQNIETFLKIKPGGKMYLTTGVQMSGSNLPASAVFINELSSTGQEEQGLFCLGEGAEFHKYYDGATDRLKLFVIGTNSNAKADFSYIKINISGSYSISIIDIPVNEDIDSRNYVLPINNNYDVVVDNLALTLPYKVAFLAGSTMHIKENASFTIQNKVYLYDKELNVQPNDQTLGYFGAGNAALKPLNYTAYHGKKPGVRTAEKTRYPSELKDASFILDGTMTLEGNGVLYTTYYDADKGITLDGLTGDAAQWAKDFGANITSNGGGKMNYYAVGTQGVTYQYDQPSDDPNAITIPVHNARLRNADGTFSGGENAQVGETYLYFKEDGMWFVPDVGIPTWRGDEFMLTLPKDSTQHVVADVVIHGVTLAANNPWNIQVTGSQFAMDGSFDYEETETGGKLTIPVKYTHKNIHNVGAPNEGSIVIKVSYVDPMKGALDKTITIPLTATENYKPSFTLAVVGQNNDTTILNNGDTYQMQGFVNLPTEAKLLITPAANNVAQSLATWGKTTASPFAFDFGATPETYLTDAKLTYTPSAIGTNSGTLEVKATYTDATPLPIDTTVLVYLNATAERSLSKLAFVPEVIGDTIYQGSVIEALLANTGNSNAVNFTLDGQADHELVTIEPANGNYRLTAKTVASITEPRTIRIVAMQETDNAMLGDTLAIELTVVPPAAWNWANLYFGSTTNIKPVTTQNTERWTLTELTDAANLITLTTDPTYVYVATVGTPADASQVYTATFRFKQGSYSKEFTSEIFADPRVVSYCVDNERTYKGVTVEAKPATSVTYNSGVVSFASTAENTSSWTMAVVGVPNELVFTPLVSDNAWRIEEYNGTAWTTTYSLDNIPANTEFRYSLQPTTQQIRITYAAGSESVGQLSNICVTALETVKTNTNKVYMPIAKDANGDVIATTQKVVLYSTLDKDLTISLSSSAMSTDVETLPAKTGAYIRQEVTITNNEAMTENIVNLYVKDGATTLLTLPIHLFEFRQGLPVDLSTDATERYYFLTTASATDQWATQTSNVRWDEINRAVVFKNTGGASTTKRSVVFAFEGAADYIQFNVSDKVTLTDWLIEESADGNAWGSADDTLKIAINEGMGIQRPLNYNTRYVRVSYNGANMSKMLLTNLVIKGSPHLIVNPQKINLNDDSDVTKMGLFTMTAINLQQIRVESNNPNNFKILYNADDLTAQVGEYIATPSTHPAALGTNKVGNIQLGVAWQAINTIDDGKIIIYNDNNDGIDTNDSILATIQLLGAKGLLTLANAKNTGVYTGIPDGTRDVNGDGTPDKFTYHGSDYEDYPYHEVDLTNTFTANGEALFDYLFVFAETTPASGTNITKPEGRTLVGSNARTPYYIYKKTSDTSGKYVAYQFVGSAETNVKDKATIAGVVIKDSTTTYIEVQDSLRVYMTGFAPYATTGYTKTEEGVFLFRGTHGAKLDVYLEDCHIFSRNKTINGNGFYGDKEGGETFSEGFARGSGGVLVFENTHSSEQLEQEKPFDVTIHSIGNNLLKSNYGCFYLLLGAMKAYQISAPVHIHMASDRHIRTSKTNLNFDDLWPTDMNAERGITKTKRTNGYLGLKKQSNNAPSIDMGNAHTVVNFKGGQIELQNAQIVSTNYKTTLAISHRSGVYGGDDVGIRLSYGIGTDSVGGTVNIYDGTVTVEPMYVKPEYRQYYLMDSINGAESEYTSCLRTPKNTYIYGGSVCRVRACQHVTSKGGAPKDGPKGSFLGQYVYTLTSTDVVDPTTGLVKQLEFPNNVANLKDYHSSRSYVYGLNSVMPDDNDNLYFWIPDGYGGVEAEEDKFLSTWKACMTEIRAGLGGVVEGAVGGDTPIEPNEEVKYFLYCNIDQNMLNVIRAGEGEGEDRVYSYKAPVAVPAVASGYFNGAEYTSISPTFVSDTTQYQVVSDTAYTITDKVFYVTTATADIWQSFTAPFDVARIYVVETYPEEELEKVGTRSQILLEQAKHNADFAAFFAVAMAIGTTDDFEKIFASYKKWAYTQDTQSGVYSGTLADYNLRGMKVIEPYYGGNWRTANYYLNHNTGNWTINTDGMFEPKWQVITKEQYESGLLLQKGETYSMLFPHSMQKYGSLDSRQEWDYWSGKLLIFESTNAPQTINGRDFLNELTPEHLFSNTPSSANEVVVTGNSTFACLETMKPNVYTYSSGAPNIGQEAFYPNTEENEDGDFVPVSTPTAIWPSTTFLYGTVPDNAEGMPARRISRTGEIIYDNNLDDNGDGTMTGGNIPTVGGGNDLFITSTAEGINIAVAEAQHVRVMSATGIVLYNGMVQTAVDVALPSNGVYVITGETEVHKILF